MVVPVLMASCQVTEYPKSGPVKRPQAYRGGKRSAERYRKKSTAICRCLTCRQNVTLLN